MNRQLTALLALRHESGGMRATSADGGASWTLAAPLPDGVGVGRVGPNYAGDPKADVFYASTMTRPTFKYQR